MRTKRLGGEPCRAPGCPKPLRQVKDRKGHIWYDYLCDAHRTRWTRHRSLYQVTPHKRVRKADAELLSRYRYTTRSGRQYRVNRVLWSEAHGPIPTGCVIHHIDRNPLNNNLDNLAAVSYAEHRRLHG